MPTIRLIESLDDLIPLASTLSREPQIAIDTESDSLHHYQEKVCLMQISTPRETVVLDLLRLPHLDPLRPLFANPRIEKVLHGADYDVRTLQRDHDLTLHTLFDTAVAAQLLGLEQIGLAALLQARFDVVLNKKFQKADWSRRPLTPEMIHYAALDTAHLLPLRDQLAAELTDKGRLPWLEEECALLTRNKPVERRPPSCFSVKGSSHLTGKELAVLQSLLDSREKAAQRLDCPPFKVVGDEVLVELSRRQPTGWEEGNSIPGLTARVRERVGEGLLAAIRRGQQLASEKWPRRERRPAPPRTPVHAARIKRLKEVRDARAKELSLHPGLLCNKETLEDVARLTRPMREDISRLLKRWQAALLAADFLAILQESSPR